MKVRVSPTRALKVFTGLESRIKERAKAADALTLEDALREASDASSGPLSTAELRRKDHPYARRHGTATEDPEIINEQSGKLKRSWRKSALTRRANKLQARVYNTDSKAKYLRGTQKMLPRLVTKRIVRRIRRIRRYRQQRALWAAILS